jgi:hypothetical protein
MAPKSLAQKMFIKPGEKVIFINPPEGYQKLLGEMTADVVLVESIEKDMDLIQFFVSTREELEKMLLEFKQYLKPDGKLWVTYPKGTSKLNSEINRDSIYSLALSIGFKTVSMISVDEDWSAMRMKIV